MRSGRRDLERALGVSLSTNVREVEIVRDVGGWRSWARPARSPSDLPRSEDPRRHARSARRAPGGRRPPAPRRDSPAGQRGCRCPCAGTQARRRAPRGRPGSGRRAPARPRPRTGRSARSLTAPVAARMPSAIGRSNEVPSLRTSAGARFTVMRSDGKAKPALRMAVRTRSRLSRTAESGRPTVVNAGKPGATSTSTRTSAASTPTSAAERTRASTKRLFDRFGRAVNVTDPEHPNSLRDWSAQVAVGMSTGLMLESGNGAPRRPRCR